MKFQSTVSFGFLASASAQFIVTSGSCQDAAFTTYRSAQSPFINDASFIRPSSGIVFPQANALLMEGIAVTPNKPQLGREDLENVLQPQKYGPALACKISARPVLPLPQEKDQRPFRYRFWGQAFQGHVRLDSGVSGTVASTVQWPKEHNIAPVTSNATFVGPVDEDYYIVREFSSGGNGPVKSKSNRFDAAVATAQKTFTTQETPFWSPCGAYDFDMDIKLTVDTKSNPSGTGFIGASFDTGGASRVILLYDKAYC